MSSFRSKAKPAGELSVQVTPVDAGPERILRGRGCGAVAAESDLHDLRWVVDERALLVETSVPNIKIGASVVDSEGLGEYQRRRVSAGSRLGAYASPGTWMIREVLLGLVSAM